MAHQEDDAAARASVAQSLRRRRRTALMAFAVISVAIVALGALSPALGWGFVVALIVAYGGTTIIGQVLLRRVELRLRRGARLDEVEADYRRTMQANNVLLVVLLVILILLFRLA